MEPAKIYNTYSKRMVTIAGVQYNKLLKEGYTISNNELIPPINKVKPVKSTPVLKKSTKPISVKSTPVNQIKSTPVNQVKSTYVNSTSTNPITHTNQHIKFNAFDTIPAELYTHIVSSLPITDLIELDIVDKQWHQLLNTKDILVLLANQYKLPLSHTFSEFVKSYDAIAEVRVIAEGGGMSSEWFTDLIILRNNKVKIVGHYRLFWDNYERWPEDNKKATSSKFHGETITAGENRIVVSYKIVGPLNRSTIYTVVNPKYIFGYNSYKDNFD